jgi:hypothetical protein
MQKRLLALYMPHWCLFVILKENANAAYTGVGAFSLYSVRIKENENYTEFNNSWNSRDNNIYHIASDLHDIRTAGL